MLPQTYSSGPFIQNGKKSLLGYPKGKSCYGPTEQVWSKERAAPVQQQTKLFLPRVMWVPKVQTSPQCRSRISQPGFSEGLEMEGVKELQKESTGELEDCTKNKDIPVIEPLVEQIRKKMNLAKADELQYLPIHAVPICVKAGVPSGPKCSRVQGNVVKDAGETPSNVPETSGKNCGVGHSGRENVQTPHHAASGMKDSQMEQKVHRPRNFTVVINKPYIDIMSKSHRSPLKSPQLVKSRQQRGKRPAHYTPTRRGQHWPSPWRKLHGQQKINQNNRSMLSARFAELRSKDTTPKEETVVNDSPEKTPPTSGIPVPPVHEWLSSFFGMSSSYRNSRSDTGGSTDDDGSFVKLRSMLRALQTGNVDQLKAGDGRDLEEDEDDMKDFDVDNSITDEDDEEYDDDDVFEHLEMQEEDKDTFYTDKTLQVGNSTTDVSVDDQSDVKKPAQNVWGILDMKHNNNNNNNVENSCGRSSPVVESWLQATYKGGKNVKLSEEEIPTGCDEDVELIDWKQLACLLCRRKFNCKGALLRHQQFSNLHQSNLELKRRDLEAELKVLEMEIDPSSSSSSSSSIFPYA